MNETKTKREKLVQKRVEIQKMIKELNNEIIRDLTDEFTKETAYDVRNTLIVADNLLNAFELKRM